MDFLQREARSSKTGGIIMPELKLLNRPLDPLLAAEIGAPQQPGASESGLVYGQVKGQKAQSNVDVLLGGNESQIAALVSGLGGRVLHEFKYSEEIYANVPSSAVTKLNDLPSVQSIHSNGAVYSTGNFEDAQVGAPTAWSQGYNGTGVIIAILDSGVDSSHPELAGRVILSQDFSGTGNANDVLGHGTFVAGLAAGSNASGGQFNGIAPGALIIDAKVLNDSGEGTEESVMQALEWAANPYGNGTDDAQVISMSLGGAYYLPDDPLYAEITSLTNQGIAVVAASGNCGSGCPSTYCGGFVGVTSPGSAPDAITVGAVDSNNNSVCFSGGDTVNGEIKPDLVAPGVNVESSIPGDGYLNATGTSMSTPIVSGAAAVMLQKYPGLSPRTLKLILEATANNLGNATKNIITGAGMLNLAAAIDVNASDYTNLTVAVPQYTLRGALVTVNVNTSVNVSSVSGTLYEEDDGASTPLTFSQINEFNWQANITGSLTENQTSYLVTAYSGSTSSSTVFNALNYSLNVPSLLQINGTSDLNFQYGNFDTKPHNVAVVMQVYDSAGNLELSSQSNEITVQNGSVQSFNFNWAPNNTGFFSVQALLVVDGQPDGNATQQVYVTMPQVGVPLELYTPLNITKGQNATYVMTAQDTGSFPINATLVVDAVLGDKLLQLFSSNQTTFTSNMTANLTATGLIPLQGGNYNVLALLDYGDQQVPLPSSLLIQVPPLVGINASIPVTTVDPFDNYYPMVYFGQNFTIPVNVTNSFGQPLDTLLYADLIKDGQVIQTTAINGFTIAGNSTSNQTNSSNGFGNETNSSVFQTNAAISFNQRAGLEYLRFRADYEGQETSASYPIFVNDTTPPAGYLNYPNNALSVTQNTPILINETVTDASDITPYVSVGEYPWGYYLDTTVITSGNTSTILATNYYTNYTGWQINQVTVFDEGELENVTLSAVNVIPCTQPPVLVVEDAPEITPLINSTYCVAQWQPSVDGSIPSGYLSNFAAVIWNTQNEYFPITDSEATELGQYYSNGGRIAFIGASTLSATAQSNSNASEILDEIIGASTSNINPLNFSSQNTTLLLNPADYHPITYPFTAGSFYYNTSDGLLPDGLAANGSQVLASFNETGYPAILVNYNGTGKSAALPFYFSGLLGNSSSQLASSLVSWLLQNATQNLSMTSFSPNGYPVAGQSPQMVLTDNFSTNANVSYFINGTLNSTIETNASTNYFNLPNTSGLYYVYVRAQTANGGGQSDYSQDALNSTVRVAVAGPDIKVNGIAVTSNSTTSSSATAYLQNIGGSTGNGTLLLYANNALKTSVNVSVAPGVASNYTLNYNLSLGAYSLTVSASIANDSDYSDKTVTANAYGCNKQNVLVVSDDNVTYNDSSQSAIEFVNTLDSYGYCVSYWNSAVSGTVTSSLLNQYPAVVWSAGSNFGGTLSQPEVSALESYSGPILFEGQNLLLDNYNNSNVTTLLNGTLGQDVALANDTSPNLSSSSLILAGITNLTINATLSPFPDSDITNGTPVANWTGANGSAISDWTILGQRYAYFSFNIPSVENQSVRQTLENNAVNWLLSNGLYQNTSISLALGWNLVSFPVLPSNASVENVLSPISGQYFKIQTFNSSTGNWVSYDNSLPASFQTLQNLSLGSGYWIYVNQSSVLSVYGNQPGSLTIPIQAGWNLVPWPYPQASLSSAFSSIAGTYQKVQTYNATTGKWETYDASVGSSFDTLANLTPGAAYWLYAGQNSSLEMIWNQ